MKKEQIRKAVIVILGVMASILALLFLVLSAWLFAFVVGFVCSGFRAGFWWPS